MLSFNLSHPVHNVVEYISSPGMLCYTVMILFVL